MVENNIWMVNNAILHQEGKKLVTLLYPQHSNNDTVLWLKKTQSETVRERMEFNKYSDHALLHLEKITPKFIRSGTVYDTCTH